MEGTPWKATSLKFFFSFSNQVIEKLVYNDWVQLGFTFKGFSYGRLEKSDTNF